MFYIIPQKIDISVQFGSNPVDGPGAAELGTLDKNNKASLQRTEERLYKIFQSLLSSRA
jgi:hypothetical protein